MSAGRHIGVLKTISDSYHHIRSLHSNTRDNHSVTESVETSECRNYKHGLGEIP